MSSSGRFGVFCFLRTGALVRLQAPLLSGASWAARLTGGMSLSADCARRAELAGGSGYATTSASTGLSLLGPVNPPAHKVLVSITQMVL